MYSVHVKAQAQIATINRGPRDTGKCSTPGILQQHKPWKQQRKTPHHAAKNASRGQRHTKATQTSEQHAPCS